MIGFPRPTPRLFFLLAFAASTVFARAQTINAVYFGQTHVLKSTDSYFGLVANREALIKVHVTAPGSPAAPAVTATLSLAGQTPLVLPLTGPATLPASIPDGPGVVQHAFSNTFTGYIPAAWVKKGLQITVNAGAASTSITSIDIGAPTKVIMTMLDVHYFAQTTGNYPTNTFAELEAKWPVADLEVRRLANVVFPELVIPPRQDVGAKAYRIKSKSEYEVLSGLSFDGEQAAALEWNGALKRAAGRSGRWSLYYMNIYNANAGGQAGGFAGVGNGTSVGILHHELGHALSLPHWGDNASYPYKGDMHGIQAPSNYNETHAGPAWAFDLRTKSFIPPTVQSNNVGGEPAGTYKVDPMQGGGTGYQEPGYLMNHFSDYSVNQMRDYLHGHVVVWNPALGSSGSWASWNQTAGDYTTTVSNNGVQFPTTRDTQVISILASMSGAKPDVNMVYPPIGPYTSGLIRLFDPAVAADRTAAQSIFAPTNGCDYCVRVVQGGVTKTYMLPASALTSPAQTDPSSLETEAINLPASGGTVTKIELLSTPNVEDVGLPANPSVLYTWAPITPDPAGFESPPVANSSSAITMTALPGLTSDISLGAVEYLFTETSGNPGGSTSPWQTSRSYTDLDLQPGLQYSYTVTMRAGTFTGSPSAEATATTPAPAATQTITVDSTRQFSLQSGNGLKSVTGLGTFDAAGADKLVVVISTEDANNNGTGFVYDVRYNGKVMTEAIQEDAGSNDGTAAIFYLDNPGAIGGGTIQVSAENPNGGMGCAYALSNTKPGFGASNKRTGSAITSLPLTTSANQSLVIAVLDNAGSPNGAGTPTIASPYTQASTGNWSGWGGHASGYRLVATPASAAPTFNTNTGSGYSINMAAVEFLAQEVAASVWTQTAGGSQAWTTGTNWSGGLAPSPVSGSTVDFSTINIASNTTLNLGANRTAQLWKFGDISGSQTWTVSGGFTLTLAGSTPAIEVKRNTTRLDCVLDGSDGLIKIGAGNLTLTATNTYTGATTINAGILQIGNGGTTGSLDPASAITNHASLVFSRTNTLTQGTDFAGVISGTGSLTKNGSGTLILGGDNTYTGTTTINAGTFQIGNGGTTGKLSISSAITNNAALVFNRSNGATQGSGFANGITGTGSLTNAGVGTLTLNSANTYGGLTTVNAGAIKVQDAAALGTAAAGTVVNGTGSGSASNARLELEGGITVSGEALTISGAGNFYGALSSTSGSNTWAGNVTIGSTGTRLGASTGNTLTVSGIIDSGAIETGLIIRTQDLASVVVLSGANTYLGETQVLIGKLQLAGGDNRLPVSSRLAMGSSGTNADAEFDLNGRNQEMAGIELLPTATAAKNSVNNSSATLSTLTINPAATSAFGGILKGNLALVKTGAGTQTLSGANTYTGATIIDNGTLRITTVNPSLTGTLTFGAAAGGTSAGTLDLTTASATFAGALLVRTNSASPNTITIGGGRTLEINGAVTVGYNSAATSTTRLEVAGAGTLSIGTSITPTNANLQIGNGQTSNISNTATMDLSGLSNFHANLGTGTFRVGSPTNSGGASAGGSTVILASESTITADKLLLASPDASSATQSLKLGAGTNSLNVATIHVTGTGNLFSNTNGRSTGSLTFHGATGSLTLRGLAGGASRSDLNVAWTNMNTGNAPTGTFDTTGHTADLRLGTMTIGRRTGSGSIATGVFNFNQGQMDANDLIVALAEAGSGSTGTLTLGGGACVFNNTSHPIRLGENTTSGGMATGTLNIAGGSVTVAANGGNSFRLGHATTAGGTATGVLNLTGGTLAVAGDIIRGAASGSSNATVKLSGGTLDMGGHDIGAAGTGAITLTVESGTLQNVASINGAGGLNKTTAGTLILSGINSYTGDTLVNGGTLSLSDNARLKFVIAATSGSNNRISGTGTAILNGDFEIDTTAVDASALSTGTWIIVNADTLAETFGSTFSILGAEWSETAGVWTKTVGSKKYTFNEADGTLTLGPAASYSAWAAINAVGSTPGQDKDGDGVSNAVEYVLGGGVNTNDLDRLPTVDATGANFVFSFKRDRDSRDGSTTVVIEVGATPAAWPAVYHVGTTTATSAAGVDVQEDFPAGFDTITLTVPKIPDTTKFARLKVLVAP